MGTDVRVLSVTKMKDAPTPEPMGFGLEEVTLPWRDTEGNPETSVVLVPTGAAVAPKKAKAAKKNKATEQPTAGLPRTSGGPGNPRPAAALASQAGRAPP